MPIEIIVALIGLIGVLLAPFVKTWAERQPAGRAVTHLLPLALLAVGLALIVGAGLQLWQLGRGGTAGAIDLGSTWDVRDSRVVGDLAAGEPFVYAHTPRGQLRYTRVEVDGVLVRIARVCPRAQRAEDVTYLFTRTNLDDPGRPEYTSGILDVPAGCRLEFTVRSTAGNRVGLELVAEPKE